MNLPKTAIVIKPDAQDYSRYVPIVNSLPCTSVLAQRDRTPFGQKLYVMFTGSDYSGLNTSHHLLVNNRRYAINDIIRIPDDSPRAHKIVMTLWDPDYDQIGDQT
jgi:hypothetical protein